MMKMNSTKKMTTKTTPKWKHVDGCIVYCQNIVDVLTATAQLTPNRKSYQVEVDVKEEMRAALRIHRCGEKVFLGKDNKTIAE